MKPDLSYFKTEDFHTALQLFFQNLNIPVNYLSEEPVRPRDILEETYKKEHDAFELMNDVYFLGMVDDAAFEGAKSLSPEKIESDYDGILIFGVTLHPRENGLLPTRTHLAEISRAFNREYKYTPVIVVFRYKNHIAFASTERQRYKQEWREGEKAGKVSLLRDIKIDNPHRGHWDILSNLAIQRSGKKAVRTFEALYAYWQEVFSVSLLNKKFYGELSNWYFWALKEVYFSGASSEADREDLFKTEEKVKEHNAKNLIRLLTRLLFVWFIKEKDLIPEQLFDKDYIKEKLLKEFQPQKKVELESHDKKSRYYRAILQNLFFATLNQKMGKREFRNKNYQHMNITNLMRYEEYFKDPELFVALVEKKVPFMNGGLFECLDQPDPEKKGIRGGDVIIYQDGFSDRKDNKLSVPDYIFFGMQEHVDLSGEYGSKKKTYKNAPVKGLINILNSYKFTITENTPIEEDVALDPELLGKVFENLLASYNPETKTTARKQTGSFYTPREVVNYMVDESLIAYMKTAVTDWDMPEDEIDTQLHLLLSYDPSVPFADNEDVKKGIIKAVDNCKILDPACGSGAFPMGILQKMVHILQKLDPDNTHWKTIQRKKATQEAETAFQIEDKNVREEKLKEINNAFDTRINDPDYARKLFLIENCIYGVDIQSIAAQISKLRFFISLVVDQKVDKLKDNFGIRPLPNLETKFVAANTLIGFEKDENSKTLFDNHEIKQLEQKLKDIRHRIFSAKTPKTKRSLREDDQRLRDEMKGLLIKNGLENITAKQLASWDPYDQNASSPFFDPEWMFGIENGFDVVIGNPPYGFHNIHSKESKKYFKENYRSASGSFENYFLFYEKSLDLLKSGGSHSFIVPVTWLTIPSAHSLRKYILNDFHVKHISWLNDIVFENAQVNNLVSLIVKSEGDDVKISIIRDVQNLKISSNVIKISQNKFIREDYYMSIFEDEKDTHILDLIDSVSISLEKLTEPCSGYNPYEVGKGIAPDGKPHTKQTVQEKPYHSKTKIDDSWKPEIIGRNLSRYQINISGERWIKYGHWLAAERKPENFTGKRILVQEIVGGSERRIIAAYFEGELYHSRDVIPIKINSNSPHPYLLLAIINSSLLTWYHHKRSPKAKKGLFPKVLVRDLKKFPIVEKIASNRSQLIVSLVAICIYVKALNQETVFVLLDKVLDGLVFELYFLNHMKEEQIDIFEFVEKDFKEILNDKNFDILSDAKKEKIIAELNKKWAHPDSEVRNRIKLFAVRSPDILKPILESK